MYIYHIDASFSLKIMYIMDVYHAPFPVLCMYIMYMIYHDFTEDLDAARRNLADSNINEILLPPSHDIARPSDPSAGKGSIIPPGLALHNITISITISVSVPVSI